MGKRKYDAFYKGKYKQFEAYDLLEARNMAIEYWTIRRVHLLAITLAE